MNMKTRCISLMSLIFCLMMCPAVLHAQKQKMVYNHYHCKLFLKDGKVVDSYLLAAHNQINYYDSIVNTAENPNSFFPKVKKYYNEDIDSMLLWYDKYPKMLIRRVPVKIRFSFKTDALVADSLRYPSMPIQFYRGKNVDGFMAFDPMWSGYRYLYKTKDMDAAHAYIGQKHRLTAQRKEAMSEEFKAYPRFVNFINSLKANSFNDNPAYILYQLDVIIEEDKQK